MYKYALAILILLTSFTNSSPEDNLRSLVQQSNTHAIALYLTELELSTEERQTFLTELLKEATKINQ